MTTVAGAPLLEALSEVSDFRKSRGKRHALVALLALGCVAAICGCSSLTAISQWGRHHSAEIMCRLGFTHLPGPSIATLHRVFSRVDAAALEQTLTAWWQIWLAGRGALALDGKTVRGSGAEDHTALQVLAAFAGQVRVVLAQQAISNGDEIGAALALLEGVDLQGWIVTGDAKLTQKAIVERVMAQGGDYVLTAKANQPTLCDDIATLFAEPQVVAETITTTQRIDLHGSRIEVRRLQASSALTAEYTGWPGRQQVFRLERCRIDKRSGERTTTVVFGITSLNADCADAKRLAALSRGHWSIENRLHWVRDVAFDEDASRIRTGQAPQVMTILRNIAIGFLGLLAYDSPTEGLRHFAWNAAEAVDLVTKLPVLAPRAKMK